MEVNSFDLIGFDLFGVDLNSIDINTDNSISAKDDYIPTTIKPYISGIITDGSSTFTFTVNGNNITVPVDSNGSWKWKIDREINVSADFSGSPIIIEIGIINLFEAVTANNVIIVFHQNVWNMIMREIDVQGSLIQVAYQNMIDNYDVTIANASFDAEIEYLGMSGTQYVNSDFKANTTTTKVETKIQIDGMSTNVGLFGSRNTEGAANSNACNVMIIFVGRKIRFDWVNGDANVSSDSLSTATDYSITTTRGLATINETEFVGTNTDSIDQLYNFLIGNFSNGSLPFTTGFNGKFYWFKIYNNNQLVRDFIPVRKGTTGYLYDKVSGNLFGNSGTGDFVLGNDK